MKGEELEALIRLSAPKCHQVEVFLESFVNSELSKTLGNDAETVDMVAMLRGGERRGNSSTIIIDG